MTALKSAKAQPGQESTDPSINAVSGPLEQDLFSHHGEAVRRRQAPLADRLRPRNLDEFVGQGAILAEGRLLRRAIAADRVGNLILHGPPGVGKTTLARIIANHTRAHFSSLNAVLAGVKDLRSEVTEANRRLERHGLRTILFIDEVHRFNSAQQDALLPWVENGTVTLIGATTENPFFEVNKALVSRSRLFRLQSLAPEDLRRLLHTALGDKERGYGDRQVEITEDASTHLVDVAGGDARSLLNALELAVESTPENKQGVIEIDLGIAEESIQQRAVLYDKQGDAHFDTISAFIKSLRGSDADAALFWLARMIEAGENPRFIFRRMLISAGEDVGLADPQAVVVVEACAAAFERIGLPEGLYPLAQAALYLACTEKSNSTSGMFEALRQVREAQRQEVPAHLRDANRDGDAFGDGKGYRYPHAFREHWVAQQYLPSALQGEAFWSPSRQGWEGQRRERMLDRRAAQLAAAAEAVDEHPLLVSSGPEQPQLERWLQRQLSVDGERLQELRQKLWSEISWQRTDRVLILGGRSLLWSLDPLGAVAEGGLTIVCSSSREQLRLDAQLQLLDPLHQPAVLADIEELDQLSPQHRFEVVGGRLNQEDLKTTDLEQFWACVSSRSTSGTQLRLLLSEPQLGPAGGLLELLMGEREARRPSSSLQALAELESIWLSQEKERQRLLSCLEQCGWIVNQSSWQESLKLSVEPNLVERWLAEDRPYRRALERSGEVGEHTLPELRQELLQQRGKHLPQSLRHWRIDGTLP
jgi:putative ATPase|tara:strand:- start:650 stop:2932 length:2283 start_codon:yes stop_codon:yes gene_type:complete